MPSTSGHVFRPDIEGLRALAIAFVIAAHVKIPFLLGGFIGVDVFFVISGFLMTGILVKEIETSGNINFARFYSRRLLRLLPALLIVLFVSVVASMLLLSPLEQLQQISAAKLVPLWMNNIHFSSTQTDYFGPQSDSNLFLHTWSLAVEEQFYLLWPALLMFLMGAWRWQVEKRDSKSLTKHLFVVFILGYIFCLIMTLLQPQFAFYMMPTRIWQFASGGLVFLLCARDKGIISDNRHLGIIAKYGNHLANVGIISILISAIILDGNQSYPGYWALLPTLATCLVIASCSLAPLNSPYVLTNPISMSIGRVSYGWYLWHWPILLIGQQFITTDNISAQLLLMLIALITAYASYYAFENPIRQHVFLLRKPKLALLISLLMMTISYIAVNNWAKQAELWSNTAEQQRYMISRNDLSEIYQYGCDEWYNNANLKPCVSGKPDAPKTVVLLGDSIGAQWFSAVSMAFPKNEWQIVVLTKSSCSIVDERFFYARIGRQYIECEFWRKRAVEWIKQQSPNVVIIGSALNSNLSKQQWINGSTRIFKAIAPVTNNVFVIAPTPILPFDAPSCLARLHWKPQWARISGECEYVLENNRANLQTTNWLEQAAKGIPKVTIIHLDNLVCPDNLCKVEQNGTIVYRDSQHLTNTYVRSLSNTFAEALRDKK